jgi:hypothetical protein
LLFFSLLHEKKIFIGTSQVETQRGSNARLHDQWLLTKNQTQAIQETRNEYTQLF